MTDDEVVEAAAKSLVVRLVEKGCFLFVAAMEESARFRLRSSSDLLLETETKKILCNPKSAQNPSEIDVPLVNCHRNPHK